MTCKLQDVNVGMEMCISQWPIPKQLLVERFVPLPIFYSCLVSYQLCEAELLTLICCFSHRLFIAHGC